MDGIMIPTTMPTAAAPTDLVLTLEGERRRFEAMADALDDGAAADALCGIAGEIDEHLLCVPATTQAGLRIQSDRIRYQLGTNARDFQDLQTWLGTLIAGIDRVLNGRVDAFENAAAALHEYVGRTPEGSL